MTVHVLLSHGTVRETECSSVRKIIAAGSMRRAAIVLFVLLDLLWWVILVTVSQLLLMDLCKHKMIASHMLVTLTTLFTNSLVTFWSKVWRLYSFKTVLVWIRLKYNAVQWCLWHIAGWLRQQQQWSVVWNVVHIMIVVQSKYCRMLEYNQ